MRISINHVTKYVYSDPIGYSVHRLRLTPRSFVGQEVVAWQIEAPGMDRACKFQDAFGNEVHLITTAGPQDHLTVTAAGVVETEDRQGIVAGLAETAMPRMCLRRTPQTQPDEKLLELAEAASGRDSIEILHDLMDRIGRALEYRVGVTTEETSAAEALAAGCGVCQDYAHIFIGAARVRGIPARYVTGYLVAQNGEVATAHHGWAEAFVPGLGWVGFDVTNGACPTEAYVRLACGLDADHAAPIRGSRRGGGNAQLRVEVAVGSQAAQQ